MTGADQNRVKPDPIAVATVRGLRRGLGVEDIALLHHIDVATVRHCVDALRRAGLLRRVINGGRA